MQDLTWMEQHLGEFDPPATLDEVAYLKSRLHEIRQYRSRTINYLWLPPHISFERLPMDDAYMAYISEKK